MSDPLREALERIATLPDSRPCVDRPGWSEMVALREAREIATIALAASPAPVREAGSEDYRLLWNNGNYTLPMARHHAERVLAAAQSAGQLQRREVGPWVNVPAEGQGG